MTRYSDFIAILGLAAVGLSGFLSHETASGQSSKRTATVEDAIEMTDFGSENYIFGGAAHRGLAEFSPNGNRFVVVVKKGNVHKDTNDYRLLLFKTDESFKS